MARKEIQKIYGYVDLTDEMREWVKKKITRGDMSFAVGWRTIPAHHRGSTSKQIIMYGYPDCEESHLYWFLNPNKRDRHGDIIDEPLPILSERDKEYFREENAKVKNIYGFNRYRIIRARKNYIEEYVPENDFTEKTGARKFVTNNITGEDEPIQVSTDVLPNKRGRPKKSRTETRLVT